MEKYVWWIDEDLSSYIPIDTNKIQQYKQARNRLRQARKDA